MIPPRPALAEVLALLDGVTDPSLAVQRLMRRDLWPAIYGTWPAPFVPRPRPSRLMRTPGFTVPDFVSIASLGMRAIRRATCLTHAVAVERGCAAPTIEWTVMDPVRRDATGPLADLCAMGLDLMWDFTETDDATPSLYTIVVPPHL